MEKYILQDNENRYRTVSDVSGKEDVEPVMVSFPEGSVFSTKKMIVCMTDLEELQKGEMGELGKKDKAKDIFYASAYGVFTVNDIITMYLQILKILTEAAHFLKESNPVNTGFELINAIRQLEDDKGQQQALTSVIALLFN